MRAKACQLSERMLALLAGGWRSVTGQSSSYPRRHLLYFVLAGFNLLTVLCGLGLIHQIMRIYTQSVLENQQWDERQGRVSNLGLLATRANAPGNDIFTSHDVPAEVLQFKAAREAFDLELRAMRADLGDEPMHVGTVFLADLARADAGMNAMEREAASIFSVVERGEVAQAAGDHGAGILQRQQHPARFESAGPYGATEPVRRAG